MHKTQRLDIFLVENGFFETREKAKASIMAGLVYIDGQISDKPGISVKENANIYVKSNACPYVSRGGFKLEKALEVFDINLEGLTAVDIGSSTGGFTDCMLQRGAAKVYAIDVGTNQLDYKLRIDERVVVMEKTNFRYIVESQIPEKLDFACTDVSFISLKHIFPNASKILKPDASMVCLIKPQFEAGKSEVGKHGIVKEKKTHVKVIQNVCEYAKESGFIVKGLDFSPITGAKGNVEFLAFLKKTDISKEENAIYQNFVTEKIIVDLVENAHQAIWKEC